ncbi:MAG: sugar transferase [Bacteroidetes bacterium]|nr:sugar transferase [Bacteroidota bacterium]
MQRFFDIVLSSLALVVLMPVFVLIILILRFTGEGEVFFIQDRIGLGKKPFKLFKFATMVKNSSNLGSGDITVNNDPRVLPFGKFLRKTKLNEFPQIINVFLGSMSVVGPRPLTKKVFGYYTLSQQNQIAELKPGLTGIGSIFFRDEERFLNRNTDPEKFYMENISPYKAELEIWYSRNNSIRNYFLLILLTIYSIINPESDLHFRVLKKLPAPPRVFLNQ